jgi:hypothetical protein
MNRVTKELWNKSGIYCLVNTDNQKKYVGSSKNIYQRLQKHRAYLRKNIHENKKLQNSWNKHGEGSFQYYILEFCSEEQLLEREQFYIDTLKPWYNLVLEVKRLTFSKESRDKMSKSRIEGFKKGTVKAYQEKTIHQYTLNGEYIQSFDSIKEASEKCKISCSSIHRFLSGEYKKGGNFLWSLTKEEALPPYKRAKKEPTYVKPVIVEDLYNGSIKQYESLISFSRTINKNVTAVRHAMVGNYPYLRRYMIKKVNAV